jgi:hypothetical protein
MKTAPRISRRKSCEVLFAQIRRSNAWSVFPESMSAHDRVGNHADNRARTPVVRDDHRRRGADLAFRSELHVALDAGRNRRIFRELPELFSLFRREHAVDHGIDVAGLAPGVLLQKERIGDRIEFPQLVRGRGQRRGLARELVLRQREVMVHQPYLPLARVVFLEPLDGLLVQRLAGRALKIAEHIYPDGGRHGPGRAARCRLSERRSSRGYDEGQRGESQ